MVEIPGNEKTAPSQICGGAVFSFPLNNFGMFWKTLVAHGKVRDIYLDQADSDPIQIANAEKPDYKANVVTFEGCG